MPIPYLVLFRSLMSRYDSFATNSSRRNRRVKRGGIPIRKRHPATCTHEFRCLFHCLLSFYKDNLSKSDLQRKRLFLLFLKAITRVFLQLLIRPPPESRCGQYHLPPRAYQIVSSGRVRFSDSLVVVSVVEQTASPKTINAGNTFLWKYGETAWRKKQ